MFCEDKIIALYCIIDELMKGIEHHEDHRRRVNDSEVITTAIVSALYFGGHQDNARHFMRMTKLVPHLLDKSRFNRRLHEVAELLVSLFYQIGDYKKIAAGAGEYVIDSFLVALCDNIRISRSRLLKGKQWRESKPVCEDTFTV